MEIAPPAAVVDVAAGSLARTGLFLLGEAHGLEETPRAILGLLARLDVKALALEWAHDELDVPVHAALATGRFDADALWALPAEAEVFSGDGRFTAGHVRLLESLAGRLAVVLLDRVGSEGAGREAGMASRLLEARSEHGGVLAVLGAGHVVREPYAGVDPVGLLLDRVVPKVANGVLAPPALEHPRADCVFPLPSAKPGAVPRHPQAAE